MSVPKVVEIAATAGAREGVRFDLRGSRRAGYVIDAYVWYDSFVAAELSISEAQRHDLIALLTAAAPKEAQR